MKTCTNCPGRTDHSTAECPLVRDDLTADSAQARAGDVFRAPRQTYSESQYVSDWLAAQQRRELEEFNMKARVRTMCGVIEMKLGMVGRAHP